MGVIGGLFKLFVLFFLALLSFISLARKDYGMMALFMGLIVGVLIWLYFRGKQG